jgi:two-component system sensor kinase FixL
MDDQFFRELVARSRDAIITIDADSTVLFASDGVERVLGHDPDELEGESLLTVMPARFQERHEAAVAQYVSEGERTLDWDDIQLPAEHADGHEVPLSIVFEEHEYEGEPVFSGIMRDISERQAREERLEQQNEQLEQFAGVVTHDLRDPLNTAQATLTLLRAQAGDEATLEYVDDLEETLDRMEALVQGVLTLTRGDGEVTDTERVDLGSLAESAWGTVARPGATLTVDATGLTVEANAERLRALLENLFRNSVEHGPTGPDAGIQVEVGRLDDEAGFYVADDGQGIPPEEREQVFEQGHTSGEGVGLGLAIVRTVAEAHGWSIQATESDSGGARFEIRTESE